ncbi:MAG: AMP-binding protein [Nonomuraea sp.]|nr:AMP-binding protein [Nonomuraea sp.]
MSPPTDIADRGLLRWIEESSPERGLRFTDGDDAWAFSSYADLGRLALRVSAALRGRGIGEGDVVAIVQRSSPGFVASLFGTFSAGATACSIAPPVALQRLDDHVRHTTHLLATAEPALVVCDEESVAYAAGPLAALGMPAPVTFADLVDGVEPDEGPGRPGATALLQFTSGSSGSARGVRISSGALRANITAMRRWLGWEQPMPAISWLPVHHDMGLVGCLMNMVVTACDAHLMQPEDFVRSPLRYLRCISDNRVSLGAMPNFGLRYLVRRVRPAQLDGLRFDALRGIILGAERIDPDTLREVTALLGPYGFDERALLPAYGGAEATLAVTGVRPGTGWTTRAPGQGAPVVGCGTPLEGTTVTVVDDEGTALPAGSVGEIVVSGPSVATEYVGRPGTASGTMITDGTLRTGDAGFLGEDGQLFVIGRLGDGLKVRGRMVFAEDLELELTGRGIPDRRAAVLLGVLGGVPTGVVVFENEKPGWSEIAAEVLREALDDARLLTVGVLRGGIAVTSSGKPRRRVMWAALGEEPAGARPLGTPLITDQNRGEPVHA